MSLLRGQKEIFEESTKYKIKDLDYDGISEMIVQGDTAFFLFTYDMEQKDIKLVQVESLDYGYISCELYLTSDNLICVHGQLDWTNENHSVHHFRKFNGETLEDIIVISSGNTRNSEYKEINEENVTYEEWREAYTKYVIEKELDEEWEHVI